jgi:plastocyanin
MRARSFDLRVVGPGWTAIVAVLCIAASVGAGTRDAVLAPVAIHGRVEFPATSHGERRPAIAQLGGTRTEHRHEDAADRRASVVYLERAPRGAFGEPDERRVRINQRGERFVPHVVAVTVGSIVDFPNNDRTYHNVFSLSDVKSFDLGRYAAGQSKSVRFDRPGIVRVFCDIHSHMSAFVLVFAHRFFAVTDAEGRFRIENVPSGTYTVVMWNDVFGSEARSVVVGEAGDVEVNFTSGRSRATSE